MEIMARLLIYDFRPRSRRRAEKKHKDFETFIFGKKIIIKAEGRPVEFSTFF